MADTQSPEQKQAPSPRARWLFDFLCRKYIQKADGRQRSMGLQYMEAETHDLAKTIIQGLAAAGYVIVPLEPSDEMQDAVARISMEHAERCWDTWRAMVEASR